MSLMSLHPGEVIHMPPYTLGEHLAKARKNAGLDQETLAEMCKVSRPLVSKWERNISVPNVVQFRAIIEATNATWLVEFFTSTAA